MDQDNNKPAALFYRYVGFQNLEYSQIAVDSELAKTNEFQSRLAVNLNGGTQLRPTEKKFSVVLEVTFHYIPIEVTDLDFTKSRILIRHVSKSDFEITNFEEVFELTDDNKYKSEMQYAVQLLGTALSTIRGVLIEKMANSPLGHLILPAISVDSFKRIVLNDYEI